jgi:hypothetical protein
MHRNYSILTMLTAMMEELEVATGIDQQALVNFSLGMIGM